MKKIVYIQPTVKTITGGVKVNEQIYEQLQNIRDIEVDVKTDSYFWNKESILINKFPVFLKSLIYNFKYWNHKNLFESYEYLFVDSRLYPRLFIFLQLLKKNSNIKIIATHHHFCYLQQPNVIKKTIHKIIELNFLKNTDKILTFSNYTYVTAKNVGIDDKKLSLNELGFDKVIGKKSSVARNNKELLFIGTVEPRKGLEYLVTAVNYLKEEYDDLIVHIVGKYNLESKYYQQLEKSIQDKNLTKNIVFHGRLSDQDIDRLKNRSSFFVFPSLYEGFGMVMAECMLYGLPVVAFDNSAMPFLVKDNNNGLIANNKDALDLSKRIQILLENENLRENLSKGAIETANNLNSTTDFLSGVKNTITAYINNEKAISTIEKEDY